MMPQWLGAALLSIISLGVLWGFAFVSFRIAGAANPVMATNVIVLVFLMYSALAGALVGLVFLIVWICTASGIAP